MAITASRPQRILRISLVAEHGDPNPFATARIRVKRVREALQYRGVDCGEWTWTVEQNPSRTGYHAHLLQHGPSFKQAVFQEACLAVQAGIPWIKAITRTPGRIARYGLKGYGADGYGLKKFRAPGDAEFALYINGGRLEHHSPGFFRIGDKPTGVKEVEAHALAELYPTSDNHYIMCSGREAAFYTSWQGRVPLARIATLQGAALPIQYMPLADSD